LATPLGVSKGIENKQQEFRNQEFSMHVIAANDVRQCAIQKVPVRQWQMAAFNGYFQ